MQDCNETVYRFDPCLKISRYDKQKRVRQKETGKEITNSLVQGDDPTPFRPGQQEIAAASQEKLGQYQEQAEKGDK